VNRILSFCVPPSLVLALGVFAAGCATTPKVDWAARVGNYNFDQAVIELGPPDKQAKLQDNTVVAEWLTQRGLPHATGAFTFGNPWYYGPIYPVYSGYDTPNYYLRLIFAPDGRLTSWKKFSN
jgi:hypothetical protein